MAKEAAETVVLVIDEEGVESLISELLRGVADSQVVYIQALCSFVDFLISLTLFSLPLMVSGFNQKKFLLSDRIFLQKQRIIFG